MSEDKELTEEEYFDTSFPQFRHRLNELSKDYKGQASLARVVDMSRQTIGAYLNGYRVPNSRDLMKIATKTGVSADWLLGLREDRTTDPSAQSAIDYLDLDGETVETIKELSQNPISCCVLQVFFSLIRNGTLIEPLDEYYRAVNFSSFPKLTDEEKKAEDDIKQEVENLLKEMPEGYSAGFLDTPKYLESIKFTATNEFQKIFDLLDSFASAQPYDEAYINKAYSRYKEENAENFFNPSLEDLNEDD